MLNIFFHPSNFDMTKIKAGYCRIMIQLQIWLGLALLIKHFKCIALIEILLRCAIFAGLLLHRYMHKHNENLSNL